MRGVTSHTKFLDIQFLSETDVDETLALEVSRAPYQQMGACISLRMPMQHMSAKSLWFTCMLASYRCMCLF